MTKFILGLSFLFTPLLAFAGPPFQTDDPDPVEYRHFEAYLFALYDGTPATGANLETPAFEMNWGAVPDLQLHLVIPLTTNLTPAEGPVYFGVGDTEVGAKYRFIKESENVPEVGIFPFVEFPSGNAANGLGVGQTWYRLPLWLQKSWGPWTTYGGGGEALVNAPGYQNYSFAGWLLQRQLTDSLTLGGELFSHGNEGPAATTPLASTMLDLGGMYSMALGFQLLFAVGNSLVGQAETYGYLALYWTWGPPGAGESKASQRMTPGRDFESLMSKNF